MSQLLHPSVNLLWTFNEVINREEQRFLLSFFLSLGLTTIFNFFFFPCSGSLHFHFWGLAAAVPADSACDRVHHGLENERV